MADRTDLEQVVYMMSADVSQLVKQNQRALGIIKAGAKQQADAVESAGKGVWKRFMKPEELKQSTSLTQMQFAELGHSARASFDAIAAGMSPVRVLAMEGPRLAQALGSGPGGLAGAMSAIGTVVNPLTVTLALLGGAFAAGAISAFQYESAVSEVQKAVDGLKNISGLTTDQLLESADKLSKGSSFGVRAIMDVEAQLISTGAVAGSQIEAATTLIEHFTDRTNGNLKEMTKLFAGAFSDPAEGAKQLGSEYGLLNKAEADQIEKIEQHSGKTAALTALLKTLRGNLHDVTTDLHEQKKGWDAIGDSISKAWDQFGRWVAKAAGVGQTKAERIAQIDQQLGQHASNGRSANLGLDGGPTDSVRNGLMAERARLVAEMQRETQEQQRVGKTRQQNRDSFGDGKEHKAKATPQDRTGEFDNEAERTLDEATKAAADAQGRLATSVDERAKAELGAIDADTKAKGKALDKEELSIQQSKVDKNKDAQVSVIEQARVQEQIDAAARAELVTRNALVAHIQEMAEMTAIQAKVREEALTRDEQYLTALAGLALSTDKQRRLARQALEAAQEREREDSKARTKAAKAKIDEAVSARDQNALNKAEPEFDAAIAAQKALPAQQALQTQAFDQGHLSPWDVWVREGQKASADVSRTLQDEAVRSMDAFNDGIANAIANGRSMGQVFHSIFASMEADAVKYLLKQSELAVFGGGAGGGGGLLSMALHLIPGFAEGTNGAPGGLAMVGERGPELVNLPKGSKVVPNVNLRKMTAMPNLTASRTVRSDNRFAITVDISGANGDAAIEGIARRSQASWGNQDFLLAR